MLGTMLGVKARSLNLLLYCLYVMYSLKSIFGRKEEGGREQNLVVCKIEFPFHLENFYFGITNKMIRVVCGERVICGHK